MIRWLIETYRSYRMWNCAHLRHRWRAEPVLNGSRKPNGMIVHKCRDCPAKYITMGEVPNEW